jgi:hypothetical protein
LCDSLIVDPYENNLEEEWTFEQAFKDLISLCPNRVFPLGHRVESNFFPGDFLSKMGIVHLTGDNNIDSKRPSEAFEAHLLEVYRHLIDTRKNEL